MFASCTFASKDSTIGNYFSCTKHPLVNTIHSSSLAAHKTGYIRPAQDNLTQTQAKKDVESSYGQSDALQRDVQTSTPEQIQTALAQVGLNRQDSFFENTTARNVKALQAYTQTSEHINQTQLENIISRVDYYA